MPLFNVPTVGRMSYPSYAPPFKKPADGLADILDVFIYEKETYYRWVIGYLNGKRKLPKYDHECRRTLPRTSYM